MEVFTFLNIAFIIAYLLIIFFLFKKSFTFAFIFGLIIFQSLTILPSLFYIETGIYISEQGRQSFFVGATMITVLYFIITFFLLIITFKYLNKYNLRAINFSYQKQAFDNILIKIIVLSALGILYLNVSLSPVPLFNDSVNRFSYWGSSKFPFLNSLFGDTAMFIPFALGYLFLKNRKFSIFFFLVYIFYIFLIGQKFSPIVKGSFSFLLPIIILRANDIKNLIYKKFLLIMLSISIGGFIIYTVIYNKYENTKPFANAKIYDPNEAMFYRIFGLQGHLMWGATERFVANDRIQKTYNPLDLVYGMRVMMQEFADNKAVLKSNSELGYNFTNAYPAILVQTFPLSISLLIHSFFIIVFIGFIGWMLKEFVLKKAGVMSVVVFQLFMWSVYAFTMGYFYKLFYLSAFLILYFLYLKLTNRQKINA